MLIWERYGLNFVFSFVWAYEYLLASMLLILLIEIPTDANPDVTIKTKQKQ